MFKRSLAALAILSALSPKPSWAQGGPPLVTDDPDTPGDGNWEINAAATLTAASGDRVVQVPYFDVNYGWGERIQLKIEGGETFLSPRSGASSSGWGDALAGVKWRFIDEESRGFSMSTYPQAQLRPFFSSRSEDIAEPGFRFLLPLEASKRFGHWGVDGELGFQFANRGSNELIYGTAVGHSFSESFEALGELHGETLTLASNTEWFFNVGGKFDFSKKVSLIFSAGHTLRSFDDEPGTFFAYLGAQLRL